jgi:DNA-binding NtrC family response regulator
VNHYLRKYAADGGPKVITPDALSKLTEYHWPGNIRELANVVQSLTILARGNVIDESVFPAWVMNGPSPRHATVSHSLPPVADFVGALKDYIASAEKYYIERAMKECDGDKSQTARLLKVGRTTLYSKMRELGIA